jgi:hypothetical protein
MTERSGAKQTPPSYENPGVETRYPGESIGVDIAEFSVLLSAMGSVEGEELLAEHERQACTINGLSIRMRMQ